MAETDSEDAFSPELAAMEATSSPPPLEEAAVGAHRRGALAARGFTPRLLLLLQLRRR